MEDQQNERDHQKEEQHHQSSLPVDRGWAWFVMLGCFLNSVFYFIFLRSLSIFFIEFLDKYQESATVTTTAFSLNTAAFSIGAVLLPPVLLSRFSVRFVALLGAFMNGAAIVGLAYSPNTVVLSIMFVVIGFANPLIFISQVALLGQYFKKRLSFAMAFANLGLSFAIMVGPYMTRVLLDAYGLSGALLIHAGLNFNLIPSCMLFRPPSFYTRWDFLQTDKNSESPKLVVTELNSSTECFDGDDVQMSPPNFGDAGVTRSLLDEDKSLDTSDQANSSFLHPRSQNLPRDDDEEIRRFGSNTSLNQSVTESQRSFNWTARDKTISEICIHPLADGSFNQHSRSEVCIRTTTSNSKSSLTAKDRTKLVSNSNKQIQSILDFVSSSSSVKYLSQSALYLDKLFASLSEIRKGSSACPSDLPEDSSQTINMETSTSCCTFFRFCCGFCNSCHCCHGEDSSPPSLTSPSRTREHNYVFFHPLGIMVLLLAGIGINSTCSFTYLPSLGKEHGLTPGQLPILMTVIGAMDLFKLATGYFADQGYLRRIHIVLVSQLVLGITFQFTSYFQGFGAMVALCVIAGLNLGVPHILIPGITADSLGPEYIGQAMSGYYLINGGVMTLTHFLIGYIKDTTGSFTGGYNFLGGLFLFSVMVILLEPLFRRLEQFYRT